MTFKFDEAVVNEQFGRRLDAMLPSVASRGADFPRPTWPVLLWLARLAALRPFRVTWSEGGMRVVVDDRLVKPRNEDAIRLIVNKLVDAMMIWIVRWRAKVGYPLAVGPLEFEYEYGTPVMVDGDLRMGTEVIITTMVEWRPLG